MQLRSRALHAAVLITLTIANLGHLIVRTVYAGHLIEMSVLKSKSHIITS